MLYSCLCLLLHPLSLVYSQPYMDYEKGGGGGASIFRHQRPIPIVFRSRSEDTERIGLGSSSCRSHHFRKMEARPCRTRV